MKCVIEHRVFGTIEWNEEMERWSGRVLLDYFSRFDMKAQAACAERSGAPLKPIILDEGRQDKAVELSLIMTGSGEPDGAAREGVQRFRHGSGSGLRSGRRRDLRSLPRQLGAVAAVAVCSDSLPEEFYADDLLIPELTARDGLTSLIALYSLSVFDHLGILGFCFGCTWDEEHGLGVLVREGKVIEVGENDITWWGPKFGGQARPPEPPTERELAMQRGIAAVSKLGGMVATEATDDGPFVQVDLLRKQTDRRCRSGVAEALSDRSPAQA